jgi:2-hydroxy-3-oxopropionate reductase
MERQMIKTVGFIGLGIMGLPMACNLVKAGFTVYGYNRSRVKADKFAVSSGGNAAGSIAEAVRNADIVITILPDWPSVKQVVLGPGGVAENTKSGTLIVDMTTVSAIAVRELHAALKEKGLRMLDAPVSGGDLRAINGTLTIMAGGSKADFDEAMPVFRAMGTTINLIGNIGAGNICKICNQLLVMTNIASVSETLTFAAMAGVDPELVFQTIRTGLGGSNILDAKGPRMLAGDIKPGGVLKYHAKDLQNAFDLAMEKHIPMPVHAVMREIIQSCLADGLGDSDHGCLIRYYEKITGTKVRKN